MFEVGDTVTFKYGNKMHSGHIIKPFEISIVYMATKFGNIPFMPSAKHSKIVLIEKLYKIQ
jgi:hypothetical protein